MQRLAEDDLPVCAPTSSALYAQLRSKVPITDARRPNVGQGRHHLRGEQSKLIRETGKAGDALARPTLEKLGIDEAERQMVVAVRREVVTDALDPVAGRTGDRESRTDLRRGQRKGACDVSATEGVDTGLYFVVDDPMTFDELIEGM